MRSLIILLCLLATVAAAQEPASFFVYFDHDREHPTPASKKELIAFIAHQKDKNVSAIHITGHTDVNGSEGYNVKLSQARARNVATFFATDFPAVAINEGFQGESVPVTDNRDAYEKNRRVEVRVIYRKVEKEEKELELEPVIIDVEDQKFTVSLGDTVRITGKDGTKIKIPPYALTHRDGRIMKGNAVISLREYYQPGDILLAHLHTMSEEGLLQTGGMFKIYITQGNDTAAAKTVKEVEIRMPVISKTPAAMNVYTQPHGADTVPWVNTSRSFLITASYWDWPDGMGLYEAAIDSRFENWRVGVTITESMHHGRPLFDFLSNDVVPFMKHSTTTIRKTSADNLQVRVQARYRRKGWKAFGIRNIDTSFDVPLYRREYVAMVNELNIINCDRFIGRRDLTDFIVKTPGFSGMQVLVYFKKLNAFMEVWQHNRQYKVLRVPANEEVILVAFGKKDGVCYYGQSDYAIDKNGVAKLGLEKINDNDFSKRLKGL
jgi:hypothetical protein